MVEDVLATAFPADCRCCDGPLLRVRMVPVCEACVARVQPSEPICCRCCGEAVDLAFEMEDVRFASMLAAGLLCRGCRLAPPEFVRAVAFASYGAEIRGLVRLLKFGRVRAVARLLGRPMAEAILKLEGEAADELLVVALPLFRKREEQRGFNQAVLLADEAMRSLKRLRPAWKLAAAHGVIERRRSTESSFVLSPRGRRKNLQGAFRVTKEVKGREVLLVDDIYTTGATARECARVLTAAGAAKVWVATVARGQKKSALMTQEDAAELVTRWDLAPT
jgi:ComF family protein